MKSWMAKISMSACVSGLAILLAAKPVAAQEMTMGKYEGTWDIQANGDVKVTRTFTLPMMMYTNWKNMNMHMMELRNFEGTRSTIEVADKKYAWDDINRTLTLNMTIMGLSRNLGDHWEAKIMPGLSFSNLDENKKTAFFHFSGQGQMGKTDGKDMIILPKNASQIEWNANLNSLTYIMPAMNVSGAGTTAGWWILSIICIAAGILLWRVSASIKTGLSSTQLP